MKVDSKKKLNDDDEWESLGGGGGRGPRLMFFLFALLSLSACAPVPLWYATGGPLHDLRRASADGEMQEQVLVASLVAPGSPAPVRWLAVEKEVAFWTDQTGWSGVRRFDVANALPGQRMSTLLEDRTGALSYGAIAVSEGRVFVAEETRGVLLEVLANSTQRRPAVVVIKSGYARNALVGGLAASAAGAGDALLYWITTDGDMSRLFSGLASDSKSTLLLDLSTLSPASRAPTALAVSKRFRLAVWLDRTLNTVYRVHLDTLETARFAIPSGSVAHSVTLDVAGGAVFVSLAVGNVTQIARLDSALSSIAEIVFDQRASPCCGYVFPLAVETRGAAGLCGAGTYTSACLPCPEGTFSASPLNKSCTLCSSDEYCSVAAAVPIPRQLAVNSSYTEVALLQDAAFGDSSLPIIFLFAYIGTVVAVTVTFIVVTIWLRSWRYETIWPKYKRKCQTMDVCFRARHYNETPAVMIHRKSVIGAFQTLLFPTLLIMLAIYIGINWNSTPIITSALVPFGHLDAPVALKGRVILSAVFWGFSGVCDESSLEVAVAGAPLSAPPNVTIVREQYACNVTWDSGENLTDIGLDTEVTVKLSRGHAAFVGYSIVVSPHYLEGVPTRDDSIVFANYANGTVMPSAVGSVFKGEVPTRIVVELTWALFNDSTLRAPIPHATGWLLDTVAVRRGDQANNVSFFDYADSVSVTFAVMRSSTYLRVLVQQTGTFLVVLGSIFAYAFTISNALAAAGKGLEWAMRSCCKKQRTRTNAFFMRPYQGPQLEGMVGFKKYNTDADAKLRIMQRTETKAEDSKVAADNNSPSAP